MSRFVYNRRDVLEIAESQDDLRKLGVVPIPNTQSRVKQRDGKWIVLSKNGTDEIGAYDTESDALTRLAQESAK